MPLRPSWTAHADLAAAAAVVLAGEGRFDGPTPPLTSSDALDLHDIAKVLAELHGRPIERRVIAEEKQADGMARHGVPPAVIATTLAMYRAARAREFAAGDPTLADLSGRAPLTVRDLLGADC